MSYTARLTVTIPPDLIDIGRKITRALDPDLGGAESWTPIHDTPSDPESPIVSYVADTPCTPEFKEQAEAMLADPAILHAAVEMDYEARWPEFDAPTFEECIEFCSGAVVNQDDPSTKTDNVPV
jgi:hypothetical protein